MAVYVLNPVHDPRWSEFVARHPRASVFHSVGWLDALRETYGYEPVVYTTTPPAAPLTNGVVLCRVASWLTGRRMVSLPFTDHCEALVDTPEDHREILRGLEDTVAREHLKYVELRCPSLEDDSNGAWPISNSYRFHVLDLQPSLEQLFRAAHKTSIQQRIRRAEREQVICEEGNSEALLDDFYRLLLMTRRRHQIPPQPIQWFRNLVNCVRDHVKIRVARKDGQSVASILTLHSGNTMVYKYGCSDAKFHHLGGVSLLLWRAIQDAKSVGATSLDFGRSDSDNEGLVAFKERWGAVPSTLAYQRHSAAAKRQATDDGYRTTMVKHLFSRMPDQMLTAVGRLLYRHIG